MAKNKKDVNPQTISSVEQSLTRTEQFLEENYKPLLIGLAVIVGLVGIIWLGIACGIAQNPLIGNRAWYLCFSRDGHEQHQNHRYYYGTPFHGDLREVGFSKPSSCIGKDIAYGEPAGEMGVQQRIEKRCALRSSAGQIHRI